MEITNVNVMKHVPGMISHKKSKNSKKNFDIFHEKFSTAFEFLFIFGIKLLSLKENYIKND